MKAKVLTTGRIIEVKEWRGSDVVYSTPDMNMFYSADELEIISEESKEVTIEGWVAREGSTPTDLALRVYSVKPTRVTNRRRWNGHGEMSYLIDHRLFPEVTWDTEPKRVKITITPVEE